jgi:hypothetical protein
MVYDSEASTVAICPPLHSPKQELLAVGRNIYALNTTDCFTIAGSRLLDYPESMEKLGPAPHPAYGEWRWKNLPPPPPNLRGTPQCSALHPNGSAFFLSSYGTGRGTFSFDTGSRAWTWLGDWLLPFVGEAYFVRELDAWVGLYAHSKGAIAVCERGHLTRCSP